MVENGCPNIIGMFRTVELFSRRVSVMNKLVLGCYLYSQSETILSKTGDMIGYFLAVLLLILSQLLRFDQNTMTAAGFVIHCNIHTSLTQNDFFFKGKPKFNTEPVQWILLLIMAIQSALDFVACFMRSHSFYFAAFTMIGGKEEG